MKAWIFCVLSVLLLGASCVRAENNLPALNIGFLEDFFAGKNRSDVSVAMKVWLESVSIDRGTALQVNTTTYPEMGQLAQALSNETVDVVVLPSPKMMALRDRGLLEPHFVSVRGGSPLEEYLLLVHRDSGITNLAGLNQKKIIIQSSVRTSLAIPWLENLMQEKEGGLQNVFSGVSTQTKISKVVLPVFFKQSDVCLVTRNGFNTLVEINPQLARQLRVLSESPGFLPDAVCFRTGYVSVFREDLLDGMLELGQEPRGLQVLMLFKVDGLVAYEPAFIQSVEKLLGANPPAGETTQHGFALAEARAAEEQE